MSQTQKFFEISCERLFTVWSTEPDQVFILDLRDADEFKRKHIPGSRWIAPSELRHLLRSAGQRLVVIVCGDQIQTKASIDDNYLGNLAFLRDFETWHSGQYPVAGTDFRLRGVTAGRADKSDFIFESHLEKSGKIWTYLVADTASKEAAIIGSSLGIDPDTLEMNELKLIYRIEQKDGETNYTLNYVDRSTDLVLEEGQVFCLGERRIHVLPIFKEQKKHLVFLFESLLFIGELDVNDGAVQALVRALPAGTHVLGRHQNESFVPEIEVEEFSKLMPRFHCVDVRRSEELRGELGHIQGVDHKELGPVLSEFLRQAPRDQEIVFICRSGARSGQATIEARKNGFNRVFNMTGGMLKWREMKGRMGK